MSSRIEIYIPRMLGNVNEETIRNAFDNLNIGAIDYIDMHRKINENGRLYFFAFLEMKAYNTAASAYLQTILNTNQPIKLVYDEEAGQYWELHKHVQKSQRGFKKLKKTTSEVMPYLYNAFVEYMHPKIQEPEEDNLEEDKYQI